MVIFFEESRVEAQASLLGSTRTIPIYNRGESHFKTFLGNLKPKSKPAIASVAGLGKELPAAFDKILKIELE